MRTQQTMTIFGKEAHRLCEQSWYAEIVAEGEVDELIKRFEPKQGVPVQELRGMKP